MEYYSRVWVARYALLQIGVFLNIVATYGSVPHKALLFDDLSHTTWFSQALNACVDAWAQIELGNSQTRAQVHMSCMSHEQVMRIIGDLTYAHYCIEQACSNYDTNYNAVSDEIDNGYLKHVINMIATALDACSNVILEENRKACIQRLSDRLASCLDNKLPHLDLTVPGCNR